MALPIRLNRTFPALGLALLIYAPGCSDELQPPEKPSSPPAAQATSAKQTIPLASIVSISGEKELTKLDREDAEQFSRSLSLGLDADVLSGTSNIFLVEGQTLHDAVTATVRALSSGYSADAPILVNQPDPPRGHYWLVAYLGISGSYPVQWLIDSAVIESDRVRFNYRTNAGGGRTKNLHAYYYWVPLGKLDSGTYKLELFDGDLKEVTLMRRVKITPTR